MIEKLPTVWEYLHPMHPSQFYEPIWCCFGPQEHVFIYDRAKKHLYRFRSVMELMFGNKRNEFLDMKKYLDGAEQNVIGNDDIDDEYVFHVTKFNELAFVSVKKMIVYFFTAT